MIISVFPYIENESVRRLTGDVLSELDRLKCHVYVTQECAGQLPGHHVVYSKPDKMMEDCDLAIAIGGDGTTLRIAKKAAFYDKCVLGINGGAFLSADVFQGHSRMYQCEHQYESGKNALCAP